MLFYLSLLETEEQKKNFIEIYGRNRGSMYCVAQGILGRFFGRADFLGMDSEGEHAHAARFVEEAGCGYGQGIYDQQNQM